MQSATGTAWPSPPAPDLTEVGDRTVITVACAAASPPAHVWYALVDRTADWWGQPYVPPGAEPLRMEPYPGGRVWSGDEHANDGVLHGTIRAFDPPERLEIGGILVPGAYNGSIAFTIAGSSLGSQVRVEHRAQGRIDPVVEERISSGWSALLARLTALADE